MARLLDHKLVRFVIVGGGAAGLLIGLTFLFLRLGMAPFAGGATAYAIAFVVAYTLQRAWTFDGAGRHARTLPRYLAVQLVCAGVAGGMSHLLTQVAHAPDLLSATVSTIASSACSFVASSRWVFADE